MGPIDLYQDHLRHGTLTADPAQHHVMQKMQRIYSELRRTDGLPERWLRRLGGFAMRRHRVRGLYLWGGVGRGKTQLMDLFYKTLSTTDKTRIHFHRFMKGVHEQLHKYSGPGHSRSGNPLHIIAADMSRKVRVLCLDEFFVSDIGDAMILSALLDTFFHHGITLIATSNTAPQDLYKDGLQRDRFLPAIQLLGEHCDILHMEDGMDYRLRTLEQAQLYYCPADERAEKKLEEHFAKLAPHAAPNPQHLQINGRLLYARKQADDVIWFDFAELCQSACSQNDYIELAREFHALLLSQIPCMNNQQNDAARRFIHLIDILYEHNVKLIVSATAEPVQLYTGQILHQEFQRAASRLQEMRSHLYLQRAHRP